MLDRLCQDRSIIMHSQDRVDVLVVTPLACELDAILHVGPNWQSLGASAGGTLYRTQTSRGLEVVVAHPPRFGSIFISAFIAGLLAQAGWRPTTILMVGIAGGIGKGVTHGDVVVATGIIDYEGNPASQSAPWSVYRTDAEAVTLLMGPSRAWLNSVKAQRPDGRARDDSRVLSGAVLSSHHVISSVSERDHVRSVWQGVLAVEMETAGVVAAIEASSSRPNLAMVRGVVDLADGIKSDGWRQYSSQVAAAVAWDFIERIGPHDVVARITKRGDSDNRASAGLRAAAELLFDLGQLHQLMEEMDDHWSELQPDLRALPKMLLIERLSTKQQAKLRDIINKHRNGLVDMFSPYPVNGGLGVPLMSFSEKRAAGVDLVIATALTEENQVVRAVLDAKAKHTHKRDGASVWEYSTPSGDCYEIASVSAHAMGATPMGIVTARWLDDLAPQFAVLVGIAAAVKTKGLQLGDVPLASEVIGYGDIAVENRRFTFRPSGFQVDGKLKQAAGELHLLVA